MPPLKRKLFNWQLPAAAAVTGFVIAAVLVIYTVPQSDFLVIHSGKDNHCFAAYPATEGMTFSVTFIHSVNQSPVCDVYQIRHGGIYVIETHYSSFGAGVQTQLEPGQRLTYGNNGEMIISGFNKKFERLSYIVGTVSDHILQINGKKISLRNLCGKNSTVVFKLERANPWKYQLRRRIDDPGKIQPD